MANKYKNTIYVTLPKKNQWMVTFSDMTTLLMTFFVLLISMSSLDAKAVREISGFFTDSTGPLELGQMQAFSKDTSIIFPRVINDIEQLKKSLDLSFKNLGLPGMEGRGKDEIEVKENSRGFSVVINGDVLFDERSAELKSGALLILGAVAQTIRDLDSTVSIEGHTDSSGTSERQYLLSLRRSGNVLDYFIYSAGLSPTRLCVGGYGPSRPVAPNDTSEGRKKNRRVEIIILKSRV